MTLSDEELDRDWKPSGRRPQSTIARSFSLELMDIFRIENSVADLDEQVDKRKQIVTTKASELEAIENRLREMETRLNGGNPVATSKSSAAEVAAAISAAHAAARDVQAQAQAQAQARALEHRPRGHQQQQEAQKHSGSRPGTARTSQQAAPGALPPTPVGSEDGDSEHDA
ncbi:hypothetical protein CMQ_6643 [Grosmannia clavigera kw1407]|uniref:Uncharacterized protein n=1 Tax=Grosmannia clavigera (strain kw1407 / UAMH 11150) TaxID=655863 RepID=F0X7D4_GROCL|nr:uncharacterized protein CMQ_6643 [Grosmannia clavigera kw1407]EFX06322.1 hypothetical protein CMQ_6643 [Grosmannia clavigera kw1407]